MGIDADEAKAILALRRRGRCGKRYSLPRAARAFHRAGAMRGLSATFGLGLGADEAAALSKARFAEDFLRRAGFTTIRSLDALAYEGAEIIHDLNTPVPPELEAISSFVYDGGTCEHVFDIAQAMRNIAALLKVGGTALISSPANGQCGHGFSPDLAEAVPPLLRSQRL